MTSTEQSKALCDGKIDAYGYTVGVPDAGVAVATDGCGAKIINLNSAVEKKLVADNPFLRIRHHTQGYVQNISR